MTALPRERGDPDRLEDQGSEDEQSHKEKIMATTFTNAMLLGQIQREAAPDIAEAARKIQNKMQTKCQINRVSQGSCRRVARITRTTSAGVKIHLCAKCDARQVGGTNKTVGEIIEMSASSPSATVGVARDVWEIREREQNELGTFTLGNLSARGWLQRVALCVVLRDGAAAEVNRLICESNKNKTLAEVMARD